MLHRSLNYIVKSNAFSTRGFAKGWLRLRTIEILQAIALFNQPQRRRERRGKRERSHTGDFAGDRSFG
ncbi:MAG: hypothetical protein HWQ35_11035 [Nostoc sp. NMS1]|uniref:hypothetical protein n=1 Tax=unclassified Nostoc TaxID=2593658 RepID=UPI0025CFCA94|nr:MULTISPECIES: hypothetical protein [unclassified Nostoc]MBN3907066.1 hypothetical protein [Nostoc sp. NMS1]MBN3991082.1 hypothetical protein [Nostoc sp. NMS2]